MSLNQSSNHSLFSINIVLKFIENVILMCQCHYCDYTTTSSGDLKAPSRKHAGEMLLCQHCDFSTACSSALLRHTLNPFLPTVAFSQLSSNMCCPRDCVSRTANVGTVGKNGLSILVTRYSVNIVIIKRLNIVAF